jgi:hypothetical protein
VGEREGVEGFAATGAATQAGRAFEHDGEAGVERGLRIGGEERN